MKYKLPTLRAQYYHELCKMYDKYKEYVRNHYQHLSLKERTEIYDNLIKTPQHDLYTDYVNLGMLREKSFS